MWEYPSVASCAVVCTKSPDVIQYFSAGLDRSTQGQDGSTKEEKGKNKEVEDMSFNRGGMCDALLNYIVCGVLSFAT